MKGERKNRLRLIRSILSRKKINKKKKKKEKKETVVYNTPFEKVTNRTSFIDICYL